MLNKTGIAKAIASLRLDLSEPKRVLICGHTGCGKTELLRHIWHELEKTATKDASFVIANLKRVEWPPVSDSRLLYPVITDVKTMDTVITDLFTKQREGNTYVFWDVYDDYIVHGKNELKKFCRLLEEAPENRISLFTVSSCVSHPGEYLLSFDDILIGHWTPVGYHDMPNWFQNELMKSHVEKLKPGQFLHMRGQKIITA